MTGIQRHYKQNVFLSFIVHGNLSFGICLVEAGVGIEFRSEVHYLAGLGEGKEHECFL
jgi:hypothetical protein